VGEVEIVMGLMMPRESAVEAKRKTDQRYKNRSMVDRGTACRPELEWLSFLGCWHKLSVRLLQWRRRTLGLVAHAITPAHVAGMYAKTPIHKRGEAPYSHTRGYAIWR